VAAGFSLEEMRGFQSASDILTEMGNAGHGWEIPKAYPFRRLLGLPQYLGLAVGLGQNEVTPNKLQWLQERGWVAQVYKDRIIFAPLVFVAPPATCFHTTPVENIPGILKSGLLTGILASKSTSKRKGCEGYIYVSFDLDAARKWAEVHLLGKTNPEQEWGIIRISARGLTGRVFRDPASSTGYMLEDKRVAKEFLEVACRFRPIE
jgi:hypothetical protein